jgi:hypothetical protein
VVIVSYNGSGTFNINTAGQPVVTGTVISSTAFNALTADLATGLSTAITKDGQTAATARIPFAQGISSTLVTDSTSTTTGSIITAGGVGIAKALYVGTTANFGGVATYSAQPIFSSLTASSAVATDASKGLVSVTNTGTGNNVLATSPTLVTPILGTPASGSLVNCTDINYTGFKNRIINGAMVIDQRNAGASVAAGNAYTLDRWLVRTDTATGNTTQQSTTVPTGFKNSLIVTIGTGAAPASGGRNYIQQPIEGLNVYDFAWGTASAATVTLSFWVRSSLTGTFGGALQNSAGDRSYPFTYTISAANTYEQKTVTIAGDTTGTWLTTNGVGVILYIGLGNGSTFNGTAGAWAAADYRSATGATNVVATSGATFYITGVQLEKGSTATSFDYRPYGTELALCQRYYAKMQASDAFGMLGIGSVGSATAASIYAKLPVSMRSQPTINYSTLRLDDNTANPAVTSLGTNRSGVDNISQTFNASGGGLTANRVGMLQANNSTSGYVDAAAEL